MRSRIELQMKRAKHKLSENTVYFCQCLIILDSLILPHRYIAATPHTDFVTWIAYINTKLIVSKVIVSNNVNGSQDYWHCDETPFTKKYLGTKGFNCLKVITEVSQVRKLNRAETWLQEFLKSWKGSGWLLVCFHAFAQCVFYRTQNQQSRDGTNHNWSSLLPLIKKNALQLNVIEDRLSTDWR